jgi:hypothetical protein
VYRVLAIGVAVFLCPLVAAAESPRPPAIGRDKIEAPATVRRDFLIEVRLGEQAVAFEKTPLARIQELMGGGDLAHAGDAGESQTWLCYSGREELVWFVSGEMGGADHQLLSVVAERVKATDPRLDQCPPIPAGLQPITLDDVGWLGTTEVELRAKLGPPSDHGRGRLIFHHQGKQPRAVAQGTVEFDVTAYMEAKMEDGKVVSIWASRVTSY